MRPDELSTDAIAALQDAAVETDDLFDVLSNPRRRFVVAYLHVHTRPMAVADVASELARWECEMTRDEVTAEAVTSRYIALYHSHVPKMANAGIIEYDRDRNTVALRDECDAIAEHVALPSAR